MAGAKFGHLRKQCWELVWFHRKGTLARRVMNGRLPVELWRPSCFPFCSFIPCPGASCGCEVRNLLSIYIYLSIYYLSLPIYHLSRISQSISIYLYIYLSIHLSIFSSSYLYLSLSHLHIYLSIPPYRGQSPPSLPVLTYV